MFPKTEILFLEPTRMSPQSSIETSEKDSILPENSDIYRDISMYANIDGFLTYRCIYDVYRQALFLGFTMVLY